MGLLPGLFKGSLTVGRQIALAFGAMGGITAAVSGVSLLGAGKTDGLLGQAFDQGLVAARFSRAVGEDFDKLRAAGSPSAAKERAAVDALGRSIGGQIEDLVGHAVDLAYDQRAAAGRLMASQSTVAVASGLGAMLVAGLAAIFLVRSLRSPLKRAKARSAPR